jgi:hypothetical protein
MLRCRQAAAAAAIAYVSIVLDVTVSVAIAAAAFSWLLIVGSAPAIAVAAGVFVATVAVHGGSAAPAALLPPLMPRCAKLPPQLPSHLAARRPHAAATLPPLPRCHRSAATAATLPTPPPRCPPPTRCRRTAATAMLPLPHCHCSATNAAMLPTPLPYSRYLQTCCILFLKNLLYKCLNQKLRWILWSFQSVHSYFLVDLTTSLQQTSWGIFPGTYSIFWYSTGSTLLEISSFWKWCVKVPLFCEERTNSAGSSVL